jgi:hypothetical protein
VRLGVGMPEGTGSGCTAGKKRSTVAMEATKSDGRVVWQTGAWDGSPGNSGAVAGDLADVTG